MISSNQLLHLIDLIGNVADAHTVALFEAKGDKLEMREHFTLSHNLDRNVSILMGEGPIGLAAETLKPQLVENIETGFTGIYKKPEELKGLLAVPVISEKLLGVLVVDTKESYQISIKLQKILSNFAEHIAWHLHQEKHGPVANHTPLPDLKELTSYCRFFGGIS